MRVKEIRHNGNTMWADTAYIVAAPVVSCTNNVVTMTCSTSGATIRYSTDGGSSWSNYSSSITISATTTYKAYATKSGMIDSGITTYTATYMQTVATPVVSCTNNVVTMTCSTSGATIRYSTNGGSTWQTYSSSITISATTTYKAYATKSGMIDSAQTSYTATYVQLKLPTPTITRKENSSGYPVYTIKTAGVSGVKYYLNRISSQYGSTYVACSYINAPTTSSYAATGTGTGNDSTWTYTMSGYSTSTYYTNIKVIGTKSGYTNSDPKCYFSN